MNRASRFFSATMRPRVRPGAPSPTSTMPGLAEHAVHQVLLAGEADGGGDPPVAAHVLQHRGGSADLPLHLAERAALHPPAEHRPSSTRTASEQAEDAEQERVADQDAEQEQEHERHQEGDREQRHQPRVGLPGDREGRPDLGEPLPTGRPCAAARRSALSRPGCRAVRVRDGRLPAAPEPRRARADPAAAGVVGPLVRARSCPWPCGEPSGGAAASAARRRAPSRPAGGALLRRAPR